MNDQPSRSSRLRYTATGALAALAAVGAIAGAEALAAKPPAKPHGHAAVANCDATTAPAPPAAGTTSPSQPDASQLFLNDVQQLVGNGTISAAQGRVLAGEIRAGTLDEETLAASGFTQAQLQAVQRALSGTKQALAAGAPRPSK